MRISYLLTCFLILTAFSVYAVNPKDDKKKEDETTLIVEPSYVEGMVYSLPRMGFEIKIKAHKKVLVPGPYHQYAEKYLGITNAIKQKTTQWNVAHVGLETFTETDPNAMFKALDTAASQISTMANGVISGIKIKGENDKLSIIGNDFIVNQNNNIEPFTDLSADDFYDLLVNAESGEESMEFKTLETKAREAADYLIRLRKKRAYVILSSSDVVPEDGKGYEAFIEEAKRIEKEYISLFAGKSEDTYHNFSFNFVPGEDDIKNEILFRFSETNGILPKTDISGKPIILTLSKDQEAYKTASQLKKSENPKAGESGLFYRIPVGASIKILDGVNTLYTGNTIIPQFGIVAPVPENLIDGNYSIKYNTNSGSIKEIKEIQ